jgi:hypothetical protein
MEKLSKKEYLEKWKNGKNEIRFTIVFDIKLICFHLGKGLFNERI